MFDVRTPLRIHTHFSAIVPSFSLKCPSWVFDRLWLRLDPGALSRLSKDIHKLIPVFVLQDNLHKSSFLLAERRGRRRRFEEGASTGEKRPLSEAVEAVRWGAHSEEGDGGMEMLRRSSVFASEVFDRSPTDKELVSQAKALCREYIHSRLNRAGIGWSKPEHGLAASGGTLGEISSVLLWLGKFSGNVRAFFAHNSTLNSNRDPRSPSNVCLIFKNVSYSC